MLRDKIKLGVCILDRKFPDWHWRVNLRELGMQYECNCVLGQLCGSYEEGKNKLKIDDQQAYELGLLSWWQRGYDWSKWLPFVGSRLTSAWRKVILDKRESDNFEHNFARLPRYLEVEELYKD